VPASCVSDCDWPPDDPAPPTWIWSASWLVPLEFQAIAVADELFVWVTDPLSPGLLTRTEMFVLLGETWFDVAVARERWFVSASCVSDCDWPPDDPALPTWVWSASWLVPLEFPEIAVADELFVCATAPSSPGLFTRTEMLVFTGAVWVDVAAALALCFVAAF
jgi:hypothetical protein